MTPNTLHALFRHTPSVFTRRSSGAFLILGLVCAPLGAASIAFQGYDGDAADTWGYTPDPVETNTSGDVWEPSASFKTITAPQAGSDFWTMQDLSGVNTLNTRSGNLTQTFATIDTSGYTDISISFYYWIFQMDSGDEMYYEIDTGSGFGAPVAFVSPSENNFSTDAWVQETINIGDASSVTLRLSTTPWTGGGNEYAGWDSVSLEGTVVPEPATYALMLGAACLGLLACRRRQRH
ncbi:PEP-CTERM sorting domain-containing protein [Cerasicoccus frondis]|uniref:PEP-CTERM sorting domain-containing protein n=1 Tax=Cerasicoccus frondis TaxID=490090 RepID=UPI00285252FB|nr:PEP-CTERM sorting domain-containing protein [Cerasicoccus frondis]